jgi:superkiller protein 3
LDAEARKKLRSLGYLAGGAVPASDRPPDPKSMIPVDNLFNEAVLASEAGRLEAAAAGFRNILEKNPRFAQAYEYAAYNLYKMERIEEAIALLQKAVSAGLWTASLASRLGLYLQESDRIEESVAVLEDAAAAAPDDTEVRNDFGVSLFRKGDVRRSIVEFEKAIALDPSQAMAFNNLGNARLALKEYDAAGAAYA